MTLVGMRSNAGQNATLASPELGVLAGQEQRGTAQAIFIQPLQAHPFFLTDYPDTTVDQFTLNLYYDATGPRASLWENHEYTTYRPQGTTTGLEEPNPTPENRKAPGT